MNEVTQLLDAAARGDLHATNDLLPLVYAELRRLAAQKLAGEKPGHTLQATALVHEAYVRLVGAEDKQQWRTRGHFFAAAAEAMRRILIESARRKQRLKHGGALERVPLDSIQAAEDQSDDELLALDEALELLAQAQPAAAAVVKLRYFAGLTIDETARALDISVRTANRHFAFAKAWLFQRLREPHLEKD